jgi:endonuclease/exonuclease/phosphatase family metal-dependent hydrolase
VLQRVCIVLILYLLAVGVIAQGDTTLTVITWNVESGEAAPDVIAAQMADLPNVDLWGLTEVENADDALTFEAGAEAARDANFEGVLSESGNEDRLLLLYNAERFTLLDTEELNDLNPDGRVRSPLVVLLLDDQTGSELAVIVTHLKSRNDFESRQLRSDQAAGLNEWGAFAAQLDLPVIAMGDYNFYYEVDGSGYDAAFDDMTTDDVFVWVEPDEIVSTQCTAEGRGCRFNSIVDFIFVGGPAREWDAISEVIVTPGDFPDDDDTSDHRPVVAVFEIGD